MPATPWDDRQALLEEEVARLRKAGYAVLDAQVVGAGVSRLRVIASDEKTGVGDLELRIDVPASYPFMPPVVVAADLSLSHHQHPFEKHLCLIERSTRNWIPDWHLDGLLDCQLRRAIAAGMATRGEAADEYEQGEPFSAYYSYRANSVLLCDVAGVSPEPRDSGAITVSLLSDPSVPDRLVGTLDEIVIGDVTHAAPHLAALLGGYSPSRVSGRWVMLAEPPAADDAESAWQQAMHSGAGQPRETKCSDGVTREILAVAFPDEDGHNHLGIGWLLLVKEHGLVQGNRKARRSKGAERTPASYYMLPAFRAGRNDLMYRAPETHGLESKVVMVIGCGAIGSMVVEQLARAGVGQFHLVDSDRLEPGNLSRHACGLDMSGADKVQALAKRVWEVNPYAKVAPVSASIGATVTRSGKLTETEALAETMKSVDLVVDATAEIGVQQYTSLISRSVGTTWISADGTPGIAGGCVARVDAGSDACFACLCWHQHLGTIPTPPTFEAPGVQPAGCASPTFTGTGFDIAVIALQATRVAVGALLRGVTGGYPEDGYDVYVLELRDEHGNPCPPVWRGYNLERHPRCSYH